ncbi:hypothetical protein DR864_14730 [Runella rosea]|uniref:Lipoprotein n=1 Tax=Runella rosea TaxID=2259595 RepID=A0A344TJU5_9BACT|nr:hypothetical protein [Runella rosea]AXE18916.1 hypothetical protein DR864_14730 [Runella rosea]
MIIKRIFFGILLVLMGCERKDIIETYVFSDMTKTQYFFYKIKREDSIVDINVKGYMDGSLGVSQGYCSDTTEFKISERTIMVNLSDNLNKEFFSTYNKSLRAKEKVQLNLNKEFVSVYKDSLRIKDGSEGTQAGLFHFLHFIPGTAKKGKIEVVFREHGYGF